MTTEDSQPIRRSGFSSRDPEETTEFFRQMYVDNHTSFRDVGERGECGVRSAATPTVRADRVRSTPFTVDITGDPLGYVLFGQLQRGSWKVHAGGEQARLGPGDTVLYPTDAPFRVTATDFDFAVVSLPLRRLGALAAEHADLHSAELRFESMAPVSAAMRRHVTNTLTMIHTELSHSDSAATHPLVAEQLAHAAATAVLAGFPNTSMNTARASGSGRVPPAAIRRATDFIEAHAVEPLTLSDIAHASGVKPRALQAGFARHHDTTPMAYLRRVRLARAHRELAAADPTAGDTVADIGARWGFGHQSRFCARYRRVYGCSPSHTLRT